MKSISPDRPIDFKYHGGAGELGKGATVSMMVDGAKVAEGELPKTIPIQISLAKGSTSAWMSTN